MSIPEPDYRPRNDMAFRLPLNSNNHPILFPRPMAIEDSTESHLVKLIAHARGGRDDAMSELISKVNDYVLLMADQMLDKKYRRRVAPSDIAQQTMLRVAEGVRDFEGGTAAEFYAWLNKIIRHQVLDTRRDMTRQKRDIDREQDLRTQSGTPVVPVQPDSSKTPSSAAIAREQVAVFQKTLTKLPDDYVKVIELRSIQDMPMQQVATEMGRSHEATYKLWRRAMAKFQIELEKETSQKSRDR